jgi:hypothetical protein
MKKRENQVRTVDCEWSAEHVFGARIYGYRDEKGRECALPPNDLTVASKYRFRLDGKKMRYEYKGPQPIEATHSFETREYVSATDGIEQKSFYGKDQARGDPRFPPSGHINKQETLPETITIHLWPLLALYRPSTRGVARELDLTTLSPKGKITVAGRECLLFDRTDGQMEKHEVVIDMNRDCAPVRILSLSRDESTPGGAWRPTFLVEIDYTNRADGTWGLAGWKTAIYGKDGKVLEQMKAFVKRCDINAHIPESVFRFDFPVGTIVSNWKTGEHYLLREGGKKRHITQAESDARVPYKRLLTTDTGKAVGPVGRSQE